MGIELSVMVPSSASTEVLAATTSADVKSATVGNHGSVFADPDVDVYVIQGKGTFAATATCLRLLAGNQYRLHGITPGNRLSFLAATANGSVRVTQGA